jgi:hypothetical protein
LPIRAEGGLTVGNDRVMPRLLLAGRDEGRLTALARSNGIDRWTTDLDAALSDPSYSVFFDAAATVQRVPTLTKAIAAGKHIYSEKPVALSVSEGLSLLAACLGCRNSCTLPARSFSAGSPDSVSISAGGCSTGLSARANGRAGTIAAAAVAALPWICIRTGGTS